MKKTNQTDLDFNLINLDETAGWSQLEVETALQETEFFDEEDEFSYEERYDVSDTRLEANVIKNKEEMPATVRTVKAEGRRKTSESVRAAKTEGRKKTTDKKKAVKTGGKKTAAGKKKTNGTVKEDKVVAASSKKRTVSKRQKGNEKNPLTTLWEKVQTSFSEMSAMDGVIAITGVLVLVVAIVTVSVFSGAKMAQQQVEAFAPLGEEMAYLAETGQGTLLAMAGGNKVIQDKETDEETTNEYEEKELDVATINVNMKMTSVQKDLKIKFINHKTGKLIPNVEFRVSVLDAGGKEKEYTDDDKDGIIYLKDMKPGNTTVTMLALSGQDGLAFNTAPQTIKVKDHIEYKKVDVSDEIKSESEINAAVEDTAKQNEVEAQLKDTVEWVASSKTEVGAVETYEQVAKGNISDPSKTAKASFLRMTQTITTGESTTEEDTTETNTTETGTTEEGSTTEEPKTTEETITPEETTSEEETTTEEETTETTPPPTSTTPENPAKTDKVTLLKDKSGNQMYLKTSDGKYVEAKYADYYNDKVVFYKKVKKEGTYKYTGWQNIGDKTYFYDKNGNVVTGEQVIQGAKYNFASDGALITGSGTLGIDVSKWNGNINWGAVKSSGVSYVIIRCGYRGSTTGAMIEDPKFKSNIKGASAAGLKVGIYFFSQAVNEVEAVEEASMTINLIKNYSISYPVFLDVEASGGRADGIDRNTRTKVIKAYCETIRNSGYTAGVYANKTWLNSYMNAGELNAYKIWLAQYNTAPTYSGKIDLWQYTSKGSVNGISGHTDLNLSYLGY